jgi:environmental stress-induced protein Ves
MIIEHIKAADLTTHNWSGGTTTQLVIYPKDSDYKKQNFQFRISTATVEADESDFTKLSGVSRKLMILNGEIDIEHKGKYSKNIKKFDQDEFSGDWETKSYGKATDFNLMTVGNIKNEIDAFIITNTTIIHTNSEYNYYGFYVYNGTPEFSINESKFKANKGDFIQIISPNNTIILKGKSEIILAKIYIK